MTLQGFSLLNNPTEYGFWYEIGIIIILIIFVGMIYQKYLVKRHKLTLILFGIFICFLIAVITSWLSKLFDIYYPEIRASQGNFTLLEDWFFESIWNFRFPMIMATISALFTFSLKIQAFQEQPMKLHLWLIWIFAFVSIGFSIIFYTGEGFYTPIAFLLVFIYMLIVYISFMRRALIVRSQISDPKAKSAFASLAIMAFCFILIFLFFLIDQVLVVVIDSSFSIFYFLAWSWSILAILSAYFGYISPRGSKAK
jgi:hypothetical protein